MFSFCCPSQFCKGYSITEANLFSLSLAPCFCIVIEPSFCPHLNPVFWCQMVFEMYDLLILNLVLRLRQQTCIVLVLNSVEYPIFGARGILEIH